MIKVVVAYVPVLHAGYLALFERYRGERLYLLGVDILERFSHLKKDIRALPVTAAKRAIEALGIFAQVEVLEQEGLARLAAEVESVVMPKDEIARTLSPVFGDRVVLEPVFLRWHRDLSLEKRSIRPDRTVTATGLEAELMLRAKEEGWWSSDWWRQIGALVSLRGTILLITHNQHLPTELEPYFSGDPRADFSRGVHIELSTAIHAEAALVARAARLGQNLGLADLFVTDFPCPPCAKLVVLSGIARVFYAGGYAVLDGERVLREAGVELVEVLLEKK